MMECVTVVFVMNNLLNVFLLVSAMTQQCFSQHERRRITITPVILDMI